LLLVVLFVYALPIYLLYIWRKKDRLLVTKWLHRVGDRWYIVCGDLFSGEDMLPRLYPDGLEALRAGELPAMEVLVEAAGSGRGRTGANGDREKMPVPLSNPIADSGESFPGQDGLPESVPDGTSRIPPQ
jgi:hypothetical protein